MRASGEYSIADLMEVFSVGRATVYRVLTRQRCACPMTTAPQQDAAASGRITDVTRRRLLEGLSRLCSPGPDGRREFLTPQHTFWNGALPETDFLARLYPLGELPSTDRRYTTALQDIVQHRVANDDWITRLGPSRRSCSRTRSTTSLHRSQP